MSGRTKFPDIAAYSRDYISMDIMIYGYWEIKEIETLRFLIQRLGLGGIFIDIGANIGCYSLGIGESFERTLAFEPCHENFSLLTHNLRFNMSTPYSAHQIALGSQHDRIAIEVNKANRGGARVIEGIAKNTSPGENMVEVFTLDEFLANHAEDIYGLKVDLLKIDVEGYEAQVIKGSLKAIESYKPVIAFEFTSNENLDCNHFSVLEDLGYSFMILRKGRTGLINRLYAPLGLPYFLTLVKANDIIARNRHINLVYAIPSKFMHLLG